NDCEREQNSPLPKWHAVARGRPRIARRSNARLGPAKHVLHKAIATHTRVDCAGIVLKRLCRFGSPRCLTNCHPSLGSFGSDYERRHTTLLALRSGEALLLLLDREQLRRV